VSGVEKHNPIGAGMTVFPHCPFEHRRHYEQRSSIPNIVLMRTVTPSPVAGYTVMDQFKLVPSRMIVIQTRPNAVDT